jgi:hypothetical protein
MGFCGELGCMPFGTDTFGYLGCSVTPATLPCDDISTTGTNLGLSDDGYEQVDLGFSFDFYGIGHEQVTVQANGTLTFVDAYLSLGNTALPYSGTPAQFVAVIWDDLNPSRAPGAVYWEVKGTEPSRRFIAQWDVQRFSSSPETVRVQVVLNEGTNHIQVCYPDTVFGTATYDAGLSATSGIQGSATQHLQFSYNQATLTDGLLIQYFHP